MTRLSPLDASFLRVETPTAHMHVGWFSMLELPTGEERLDVAGLLAQLQSRLHLAPRFRQRLQEPPLPLGEPSWRDDPSFEIERHVTVLDSAAVGARRLRELTDDFLSEQLPRDRPLWSLLVVPAVERGRAAVVGKVHHAMVDGLAAVELGVLLFDPAPAPDSPLAPVVWKPAPGSGPLRVLLDTVADSALEQFRAARSAAALSLSPGEARRVVGTVRRAALSLADDALRPAPQSHLNLPIGPRRTLVKHRVALSRIERLKQRHSVPLNDVLLAITSGALRRLALALHEPPEDLRVMIPVSVRRPDDEGGGNRITFAFIELPIAARDPLLRLYRIHEQTRELKDSGRIAGTEMLLRSVGSLPEPLKRRAARLAASPRLYNITVSNVPGPRTPLYAAGARVRSIYPVIPIPDGHAVAIGVLTYAGGLHFAAYADPDALPRIGRLPAMVEDAVTELSMGSGTEAHPPRWRVTAQRRGWTPVRDDGAPTPPVR